MLNKLFNSKEMLSSIDNSDVLIEVTEDKRAALQLLLLEMYKEIYEVCKQHGITPYLVGGSAIGAVRHRGFIPWDDDLDIGMTRDDYNNFKEVFDEELGDKYVLNAPNRSRKVKTRFPKIMKKGTVCREIGDYSPEDECGVFLDIFIIENIPNNPVIRKLKGTRVNMLEFISGQVLMMENLGEEEKKLYLKFGKMNYVIRRVIGTIFSFRSSTKWFNVLDKAFQYHDNNSEYCGLPAGRKHYFGDCHLRKDLLPAKFVPFCDIQAPVFNNVDAYLKKLYGEYMTIPPVDKREKHYLKELRF